MLLQSTLFPQPDSPTTASTSPAFREKLTSRTACTSPSSVKKLTERCSTFNRSFIPFFSCTDKKEVTIPPSSAFLFLFFDCPVLNIPENTNAVVAQHRVFGNSLNTGICHIICINIADECIGRIFCQFFLEFSVIFFPHFRIVTLAGKRQILIYFSLE